MGFGSALQIGVIGALVLGVGLAIVLVFRNVRKRGERDAQFEQSKQSADRARDAAEIDDDVRRLDDDDLDSELRG